MGSVLGHGRPYGSASLPVDFYYNWPMSYSQIIVPMTMVHENEDDDNIVNFLRFGTNRLVHFQTEWNKIIAGWSLLYGSKVSGWWYGPRFQSKTSAAADSRQLVTVSRFASRKGLMAATTLSTCTILPTMTPKLPVCLCSS